MEKLIKLLNEYEESRWKTIDDWLTEEERENWAIIEETPMWSEYEWHLRHCNANKVAYEKDTFDAYALSKWYGFIKWLVAEWKIDFSHIRIFAWYDLYETILMLLVVKENPISALISILN